MSFESALRMVLRTGKVVLGSKQTLKLVKHGKTRMVVVAANAPPEAKKELKYYASLSNIPVYEYSGTSVELGALCGKPFPVSMLAIVDPGDSNILELVGGEEEGA